MAHLKRYIALLFITAFCFCCGTFSAWAQTAVSLMTVTTLPDYETSNTKPKYENESCEGVSQKIKAEQAYTLVHDTRKSLKNLVDKIQNIYEKENGICHYLKKSGLFAKQDGERKYKELKFTDADKAGALKVNELHPQTPKCSDLVNEVNSDEWNDYTDWDLNSIKERATQGSEEIKRIVDWAKTAKENEYYRTNDATEKFICEQVTCRSSLGLARNACKIVVKKGNSLKCVDYNDSRNGDSDVVASFSSVDDFTKKLTPNADKRVAEFDNLKTMRDDFAKKRTEAHTLLAFLSGDVRCTCKKDNEGNYIKDETGKTVIDCQDADFVEDNMKENKCRSVEEYQASIAKPCLTCGLFASIMGAVQNISRNAFTAIVDGLITLLGIAFLLYVGYQTLLVVFSPETQKLGKYLNTLFVQGFKVALTILILQNPEFLYSNVITPILDGAVDFGVSMTGSERNQIAESGNEYANAFAADSKYLSTDTAKTLTGLVAGYQETAAQMPAIGRALWCLAWDDLPSSRLYIFPRVGLLISGIIIMIFGFGLLLAVGFYMLDRALSLGIVCALMAFFVACWPFKLTTKYAKVGWDMFLNVFFNFIVMGVILKTIGVLTGTATTQLFNTDGNSSYSLDNISNINPDNLETQIEVTGMGMVFVVVCCMMCFKLPKEAANIANKFAGGAQVQLGSNLGGLAMSAAKSAALGGAALAGRGAAAAGGSIAEHTGLKGAAQAGANKVKGALGIQNKGGKADFKGGDDKGGDKGGDDKGGDKGGGDKGESA